MTRIDAHQHFWQLDRGDYGWLTPALGAIHRDFAPADLTPLLARQHVDRTILVQAAPTEAETRFLLALAQENAFVAGVVGWAALDAADAPRAIAELARHPKLVGLRPMLHDLPQDDWILDDRLAPAVRAMQDANLCFDALVRPVQLPVLLRFLARWPDLPVVVDHGAKPDIAARQSQDWRDDMARIAHETSACCKLSGLVTEAAPDANIGALRPYMDFLLDAFGPERLMWGSDWPVLTLRTSYDAWADLCADWAGDLDAAARAAIFGETARRFYGVS